MAKDSQFSTGFRNAYLEGGNLQTMFDNGYLDIYSGAKPADADATEGAATLLARCNLPASNAFGATATDGELPKNGTWQSASAVAGGVAAWYRLRESGDTGGASTTFKRIDGTVGQQAGSFDLILDVLNIVIQDPVIIDTYKIVIPAGGV